MTATAEKPVDFPVKHTDRDKQLLAQGVIRYCVHLEDKLSKDASAIGLAEESQKYKDQADALRRELLDDPEADRPMFKVEDCYPRHLKPVQTGMKILARNMKAAKGTMSALAYFDTCDRLDDELGHVNEKLIPRYDDNHDLTVTE